MVGTCAQALNLIRRIVTGRNGRTAWFSATKRNSRRPIASNFGVGSVVGLELRKKSVDSGRAYSAEVNAPVGPKSKQSLVVWALIYVGMKRPAWAIGESSKTSRDAAVGVDLRDARSSNACTACGRAAGNRRTLLPGVLSSSLGPDEWDSHDIEGLLAIGFGRGPLPSAEPLACRRVPQTLHGVRPERLLTALGCWHRLPKRDSTGQSTRDSRHAYDPSQSALRTL